MVFGPDPSSHSRCTIGGNIGNNSCGIHPVQAMHYGPGPRTSDNTTQAVEIVTYDGERFWVGVDEEDQLDEIIAAGGRKGEICATCATCATATPTTSDPATRPWTYCRAGSRATASTSCCPRRASTSPAPRVARGADRRVGRSAAVARELAHGDSDRHLGRLASGVWPVPGHAERGEVLRLGAVARPAWGRGDVRRERPGPRRRSCGGRLALTLVRGQHVGGARRHRFRDPRETVALGATPTSLSQRAPRAPDAPEQTGRHHDDMQQVRQHGGPGRVLIEQAAGERAQC